MFTKQTEAVRLDLDSVERTLQVFSTPVYREMVLEMLKITQRSDY